ncbi:MAG: amino acid adenylation domain-containing protein [Gammaproteobacteria bacterium]|nr:amino acid adenylation domain-containing protein [Gammaproteobacteria bacterium]
MMEQFLTELNQLGVKLRLERDELRIQAPVGVLNDELRHALQLHKSELLELLRAQTSDAEEASGAWTPDAANRFQPFPLTDLQHAYWLGRDGAIEMGDVATHFYVEFDCAALDIERLNDALCRVIERHDMLRAVVDSTGLQRVLPEVPRYRIEVGDQRRAISAHIEQATVAVRAALSHQVFRPDRWPLFEIRATLLPDERVRLHLSVDLLMLDVWSLSLFLREWHQFYEQPRYQPPALEFSFRDYVLAEQVLHDSAAYRRAQNYWMARIDSLPPAPALPLRTDPAARRSPRFHRHERLLDKTRWNTLKVEARARGLTPSNLVMALYAEVLARWSQSAHFTLNVTSGLRRQLHPDVNRVLGEFTSTLMLEVDRRDPRLTFVEFAQRLQQQFLTDLDYAQLSGVTVMREWARRNGAPLQATLPVVYTSGLIWSDADAITDTEQFGRMGYNISQASQVWLDHDVLEQRDGLLLIWDVADAVFDDGVPEAMFAAYNRALERLCADASAWQCRDIVELPEDMQLRRAPIDRISAALPSQRLQGEFVARARAAPQTPAIFSPTRTMTYGELLGESVAVADWLMRHGLRADRPVAVLMRKGWEQLVAVYGVLLAGGAYLPIDADLPARRQQELLRLGGIAQLLTQPGVVPVAIAAGCDVLEIDGSRRGEFDTAHRRSLEGALDGLAYVIFTSGTTGVPKGVMIEHRAAMNTIEQVNRLLGVSAQDRVLSVSSLSFDLSVYDSFGPLAAGGALVLPDARKAHDPFHWCALIAQSRVTLWNSTPQLMRMLIDSFHDDGREMTALRAVLLSGDFIPLDLPQRIRARYSDATLIALGGATEASIWSNYFPIETVSPDWASIPYGKPLPNQTLWVYDAALRPCPDHVTGRIFIGGAGLARGYWCDDEATAARFIVHPQTGERLYDTGDLGRYAADGNVIIVGRNDRRVKIRGHRVELGEIEAVLRQHPQVKQCVVVFDAERAGTRQLTAYIETTETGLDVQALKDYLSRRLPEYMVPRAMVALERLPITGNGKIDYRALPPVEEPDSATRACVAPRDEAERAILAIWSRVIGGVEIGVTDNFFEFGGDSIQATQLVREINAALPSFRLEMHELFENVTIESLAALHRRRGTPIPGDASPTVEIASIDRDTMLADIATAITRVAALDGSAARRPPSAPQNILLTGGTGWIGAHVLAELLARTRAKIYCLVRTRDAAEGAARLFDMMQQCGIEVDQSWRDRVQPVCGDLAEPQWGLQPPTWRDLCDSVDSIYHLGASLNVLAHYTAHRKTNVSSAVWALQLATERWTKPVFFVSPMTVCRRHRNGELVILHEERAHTDSEGLLTGYAQSKWAAEQVFLTAVERGLPVKIYRSSHALPSARSGRVKPNDTYVNVLRAACAAGSVPDWSDSLFYGVPVDVLAYLVVENSLISDDYRGLVHIDNHNPLSVTSILEILLADKELVSRISIAEWKSKCREVAARLSWEGARFASMLFADRSLGAAVEHMFHAHPLDTGYFDRCGQASKLANLTPPEYWLRLRRSLHG